MIALTDFVATFVEKHRFKGPSFWARNMLFCFTDIYERDTLDLITDPAWPAVTKEDIETACASVPVLAEFLTAYVGYVMPPPPPPSSFPPPPRCRPLFRQLAVNCHTVRADTLPALICVGRVDEWLLKYDWVEIFHTTSPIEVFTRIPESITRVVICGDFVEAAKEAARLGFQTTVASD